MGVINSILNFFEQLVDPFKPRESYEPPNKLLGYVWYYVSQVKWAFVALLLYGFINAIVEATVFSFVGQLVDVLTAFENDGLKQVGWSGLIEAHGSTILWMLFIIAVFRVLVIAWGALIEEQVIVPGFFTLMRWQSHKHIVGQSLRFFQNDLAGRISQKVFQSGMATGDMMISLLQVIWFVVIYAVTTAGLLFALDWHLGLIIALWAAIFLIIACYFVPKVRDHARKVAEKGAVLTGHLVDSYANIQTVKLHGERASEDQVLTAIKEQRVEGMKFTRVLTMMRVSLALVNGIILAWISWVSIDLWLQNNMTLGDVAFVLALVLRLQLLSNRLLGNLNGFFRNMGVTQNTMELVARPHELKNVSGAKSLEWKKGAVEFDDVSFGYENEKGVLRDFSLQVEAGEKIGIVGPSGAGKTTMINLLMRFFDPQSGAIKLDGQDISKVTQDSLRACFSLVQQEAQLFHASVIENIAYGEAEPDLDKVQDAAKMAKAHEFILELKDNKGRKGYEAKVGERGVKLSGGQRQRIAIARAFYRNAPILIMDEATSQLDSGVELAIQDNFAKLMQGKTVFVIAHRLSTLARLDRLIVLDEGRIVDEGTHEELIDHDGLYAKLWQKQSGSFIGEG